MTIRRVLVFLAVYALILGGEWLEFLQGFDTTVWSSSTWLLVIALLVGEAFAALVIAVAIDRALPGTPGRVRIASRKSGRSAQRYPAR